MNYQSLTAEQKAKIDAVTREKYPDTEVNIQDIAIEKLPNDYLKMSYKGITIEIPVTKPDQQTSNGIWQTIAGGAIAIAAVAVALIITKDD